MSMNRLCRSIAHLLLSCLVLTAVVTSLHSHAQHASVPDQPVATTQPINTTNTDSVRDVIETYTTPSANMLIPILAIFFVFGGPVVVVVTLIVQHYRAQKRLTEVRRECVSKLIDAGKDVPESLLFFDDLNNAGDKDLSRGLKNLGLGAGIAIFLTAVNGLAAGSFGLILIGLGCAQLANWKLTRRAA